MSKTSKELLNELVAKHYEDAAQAKKDGKLVAWATSICPQELLEAMDITVVYPENHAAAIAARKHSQEFLDQSEGCGYSIDICSYARVNMGYKDIKYSEAANIPMPDMVFCCNNICESLQSLLSVLLRNFSLLSHSCNQFCLVHIRVLLYDFRFVTLRLL